MLHRILCGTWGIKRLCDIEWGMLPRILCGSWGIKRLYDVGWDMLHKILCGTWLYEVINVLWRFFGDIKFLSGRRFYFFCACELCFYSSGLVPSITILLSY